MEIDITYSGITESDITRNLRWDFDITGKKEIGRKEKHISRCGI